MSNYSRTIDTHSEKIFFTSDIHFGNEGLMLFNDRPFKDEMEMDAMIIENWNKTVPSDGLVFLLGDIGEVGNERVIEIFDQLNGSKILIRGNHDAIYQTSTLQKIFIEIHDILDIKIWDAQDLRFQEIVLCHYPLFDWHNFFEGSWQLFGHLHTRKLSEFVTLKTKLFAQQYDVGIDANNFKPVSFYEVKRIIHEQIQDKSFKQSNYY